MPPKTSASWTPPWPHSKVAHKLTPGVTHGRVATYSKGCRCRTEDGLAPDGGPGCTETWREYRRDRERNRRRAIRIVEAQQLLREEGLL